MPLHSPRPFREKILAVGDMGAGKSTGLIDWVNVMMKTKSDARAWIIDTEDAWEDMTYALGLTNYTLYPARTYEQIERAVDEIVDQAQPGDVVGFDKGGEFWPMTQDAYAKMVRNESRTDLILSQAKKGKTKWDLTRDLDWNVVNAMYRETFHALLFDCKAHLYITASATTMGDNEPNKQHRMMYGKLGIKPQGQKDLGYQMRTVLLFEQPVAGRHILTTIKDREREMLMGADITAPEGSFVRDYLKKIAGWEL